jgi:hypothetical protein
MLNGTDRIKQGLGSLRGARQAHAELVSQRQEAARELSALATDQASAREEIAARERAIAVAGGAMPDGPLPEEAEADRVDRHFRIAQAGLADLDERISESQKVVEALSRELVQAWEELGASISDSLYRRFCDAIAMVREVWLEYRALVKHFSRSQRKIHWMFTPELSVHNPRGTDFLIDPYDGSRLEKWTPGASSLLAELGALRAEIEAARKK